LAGKTGQQFRDFFLLVQHLLSFPAHLNRIMLVEYFRTLRVLRFLRVKNWIFIRCWVMDFASSGILDA
jgi:hypothetical protein